MVEKRQDVRRKLDRINNGTWESEDEQIAFLRIVFGSIGDNVIIGSNSVVNKSIPSNSIAFGSPARVQRSIQDDTGDAASE